MQFSKILMVCAAALPILSATAYAQTVNSDDWAATDALGRKVREYNDAGDKRDKLVGIFYWTWHNSRGDVSRSPRNITQIVRNNPEAMKDFNHPEWNKGQQGGYFFWEQPLFGYYQTYDKWVLRKHAEMLADAGVDFVFFDCTNGSLTWERSYEALFETWDQAQKDGVKVPKVVFLLPFGPSKDSYVSLHQLYRDVYKPGRYSNLWFMWQGKPCIMAYPDNLGNSAEDREIAEFFTFRPGQPDYVDGPSKSRNDQWGWLEMYPQHGYVKKADGTFEVATVGIAQNANPLSKGHCSAFNLKDAYGRNFSVRNGHDPRVDGYLYGWNFLEQWDGAFDIDPDIVLVTGWNEYVAGIWTSKPWTGDPFSFVDQYNWNCSRDIEPNKGWGDRGDVYYMQFVDNVRKFKGMSKPQQVSAAKSIKLGSLADWDDVAPYYASYKGNTIHRDEDGYGNTHYVDNSGRNDIVGAKVARDDENVYFYVETADALTSSSDKAWMRLFIDIDRDKATGWNGYDFVINRVSPQGGKAVLEASYQNKWIWNEVEKCKMSVKDNVLVIAVPRTALGVDGKALGFEFKWNDNMQDEGNVMDFYVSGDTAPGGRFNYVYQEF